MKKFILSLVLVSAASIVAFSMPVDPQRAMQMAKQFLPTSQSALHAPSLKKQAAQSTANIVYTHPMPKSGQPAFYIVNVGDGSFAIVSANDIAHPILGYSFSSNFPVSEDGSIQMPPQVKGFLDDLAAQMEAAVEAMPDVAADMDWSQPMRAPRRAGAQVPDSVGPLLTTTWNQTPYYNVLCPEDANSADGHALTGCVATAIAQIINYWGQPAHGRGTHSYATSYGTLAVDFESSAYDFALMPAALSAVSTQEEINAVAQLMYHCGVAVNMEYGANESSALTQDARAALTDHFGYDASLSLVEKNHFSDAEWMSLLKAELRQNRPIIYTGQGNQGGHTFVCDGYNSNDYFHFNWGWGGLADAWFALSVLDPIGYNFSSSQEAIIGIRPSTDTESSVVYGKTSGTSSYTVTVPTTFYHTMGNNGYEGNYYMNPCSNTVTFYAQDENTHLVLDILEMVDQNLSVYDGDFANVLLREFYAYNYADMSPIVSSSNALTLVYNGNLYYGGFAVRVSEESACRAPSNLYAAIDTTTVHLTWVENGSATQWQVEYGPCGFAHGEGTLLTVSSIPCNIVNLPAFQPQDFYVRAVCGADQHGLWSGKLTITPEAKYWDEVVTELPQGYVVNPDGSVTVTTAEGLVWWAKTGANTDIYLDADINLSGYKWRPIPNFNDRTFYGYHHTISGMYISENTSDVGFFSRTNHCCIFDLMLSECTIKSTSYRVGGLCADFGGSMTNCSITQSLVEGTDYVGGLIGEAQGATVVNCFVNAQLIGNRWSGIMTGNADNHCRYENNYSIGTITMRSYCYNAGIVAYSNNGTISHCYSIDLPMGVVGYKGTTIISDTSSFYRDGDSFTLRAPIPFEGVYETDLLTALNKGVANMNDSTLRVWVADSNGYPVFGDFYTVVCPNVSNIAVRNVLKDNQYGVELSWTENGTANQWQIKYKLHDAPEDSVTIVMVSNNPDTIFGIPLGQAYDFSIRAISESGTHSGWTNYVTEVVDLLYWTDLVTTQPEGYMEDADGNVTISSAEGLAWMSVLINGLHEQSPIDFRDKTVHILADIDLQGYRWKVMGGYNGSDWLTFRGVLDGHDHAISNIYVNDGGSCLGLFGRADNCVIKNVKMVGGLVRSLYDNGRGETADGQAGIGGFVGLLWDGLFIDNCHSSVDVYGLTWVGSLCGSVYNTTEEISLVVKNSSTTGDVYGRESSGGLIGNVYGNVTIKNCYATGDIYENSGSTTSWYRGGLIGNFMEATANNCYSTGTVYGRDGFVGKVIGCPYINTTIHYLYGLNNNLDLPIIGNYCENISDTATFCGNGNAIPLQSPVVIAASTYNDMIQAMNAWVKEQNDPTLRLWEADTANTNQGYPIFGDYYVPTCYNPTNLTASNATVVGDTVIQTRLEWEQIGAPDHWEVLYVKSEQSIDSGTIILADSNVVILSEIPVGIPLDFYVRAVCDSDDVSGWSEPVTYIHDKLRWTEVVTSRPEGYMEDENGNVFISSSEGLAWLISVANGYNGETFSNYKFYERKISLLADVNMGEYRWTPIGDDWSHILFDITIDGNSHAIDGLYDNELENYQGLFGLLGGTSEIRNVTINNCTIKGKSFVGSIVGYSNHMVNIINCRGYGYVSGIEEIGGIAGRISGGEMINTCFVGMVEAREDITQTNTLGGYIGGLIGVPFNNTIINCYTAVNINGILNYAGVITGTGGRPDYVANSYGLTHEILTELTSDNTNTQNLSFFSGADTTWTLTTPPYIGGQFYTNLTDALNAWVDENNADGTYLHWCTDTARINNGFPIFASLPDYVITFQNYNGAILQMETLKQGQFPVYTGATPTKPATAQYTYTFKGWDKEIVAVVGAETYTAQFDSVVNQYTITFLDEDGTTLQTSEVEYGQVPAYNGATPTKPATAEHTFTFSGWSPNVVAVTAAATYTATYSSTINSYLITFVNYDGSILQSGEINYGVTPIYNGATPTKTATAQYTYTFKGWDKEIASVVGTETYTAQFDSIINKYTIAFVDEDGTVFQTSEVEYGQIPAYNGATPSKPANGQYTYTFAGWTPEVIAVTGDATYAAQFTSTINTYLINGEYHDYGEEVTLTADVPNCERFVSWSDGNTDNPRTITVTGDFSVEPILATNQYTITFRNEDGTVLQSGLVNCGDIPTYDEQMPYKETTAEHTYTFSGWNPTIVAASEDAIYTARFTAITNGYQITFQNDNGATLQSSVVDYGVTPVYNGATPTKPATAQYTYTFIGWDKTIVSVAGAEIYTAQYDSVVNKYTITFMDVDGSVLLTSEVEYGQVPAYNGATPSKQATAQYTYSFAGWTPGVAAVVGNATYTAQFMATVNSYLVNGEYYEYGEEVTLTAEVPDCEHFVSWNDGNTDNPRTVTVTGDFSVEPIFAVNQYTITFRHEDGTVLQSGLINCGDIPTYDGQIPYKETTAEHTYTFSGWNPTIVAAREDAIYTARFSAITNGYQITFLDDNGATLQSSVVNYGVMPSYDGSTPTKQSTAEYTYTFKGWDKAVIAVIGSTIYIAQYDSVRNKYQVTFADEDGTVLQTSEVEYGQIPAYNGATPSKPANGQYTYTFAGWSPNIVAVTGNATYTATYTNATNGYLITFVNYDGSTLQSEVVNYGVTPVYNAATPTRPATAQYTYTFSGWDKGIVSVVGIEIYTAQFDSVVNKYTITFADEDGTILQTSEVEYGQVPAYNGATPSKPSTGEFTYTFAGWSPEVVSVTGNATYTATYSSTVNKYTITFVDEDGTILQTSEVEYGQVPAYNGATPTKAATAQYTYNFAGWSPEVVSVTGAATYTATYSSTVNKYTITFVDEDGTFLQTSEVEYGQVPAYNGATPSKPSTGEFTYTFAGWSPEVVSVTGNTTYTATYSSTVNKYTITFVDEDGTVLQTSDVEYGQVPAYNGTTPSKAVTAEFTYTFAGWDPQIVAVTGNATYTATYSSVVNQYTITASGENCTITGEGTYDYGTEVTLTVTPDDGYQFVAWSDGNTDSSRQITVTEDVIYTAILEKIETGWEENVLKEKGRVIFDGHHFYILRDGKVYDAAGRKQD